MQWSRFSLKMNELATAGLILLLVKRWLQLPILGFGCFEVADGAALYAIEAGMAAHVFWNLAAVLLRGHAWSGPALLLLVPPVVCGQDSP
ncbi:hypothetical protein Nepgr_023967 [Nepenthes gracilis]|uniref:Uncharacterized protein n=1 Tax=Nepenthes gracilis TaxID=150966 RepID=A0AAD3XZL8_NEPGR|nr:hypothetical protein Nepgr_023967 [Nepenthes gracilis]